MPRATKTRPASLPMTVASAIESQSLPFWEIGKPQAVFETLANQENIVGDVLDIGCGTGENALMLALRGHMVWGIDISEKAIATARQKSVDYQAEATFVVGNALELEVLGEGFHTVIDSGLFHFLTDKERKKYLRGLAHVMFPGSRFYLLCMSEHEPGEEGPRRISRKELEKTFEAGWKIHRIEASSFETRTHQAQAWLVTIERL
ncbi:SAM-dependent methyltransferase [bacterium (Candidatus Blackallbacteria) CG17_big_fil_post_rev_8_21_14_2_50_48_46]|uniref:SAM-dependent methyltransferase n=1 Tax=bacterium (Candidatus Blackallbacteria) CG17_big_fil_post_rev_8_21_14_2_50_48_46 TaxID=2014261 RepID=A0A2M7G330_9BACT|nr:MAG: SAM-dependent methyltransferase [bacterium (Candidatus Blackallbacteria) CG18_big_fil_WC_8_21_14_2_50_49_26]PIW16236.1 MAG: SAM-dependent methyltransferase [bacterium (Candidatus Blackallbacteria) CG17_big_fil_post_rev_8_21_14_2_50_48_46]PIW49882.1 MAG: SAM-dependent methyltransferase [bacterium (Candidatus Blackallbacteria) CG13_big_fil_rev_8_21_14_2_50_49_14]